MDQAACATEQIEDAAKDGDLALVRKLLDDGANVEGPDDSWTTPLFWACRKGYDDVERYLGVIRLLMERGARVDVGREISPTKLARRRWTTRSGSQRRTTRRRPRTGRSSISSTTTSRSSGSASTL